MTTRFVGRWYGKAAWFIEDLYIMLWPHRSYLKALLLQHLPIRWSGKPCCYENQIESAPSLEKLLEHHRSWINKLDESSSTLPFLWWKNLPVWQIWSMNFTYRFTFQSAWDVIFGCCLKRPHSQAVLLAKIRPGGPKFRCCWHLQNAWEILRAVKKNLPSSPGQRHEQFWITQNWLNC